MVQPVRRVAKLYCCGKLGYQAAITRHAVAAFHVKTAPGQGRYLASPRAGIGVEKEEAYLMNLRTASVPARPVGRTLATLSATAILAIFAVSSALAQAQQPAKPAAPKPAPKTQAQPAKPATPGAPAAPQGAAQPAQQDVQLIYSPWTKFCLKGQEANAKQVCFTGKDARIESGAPVVAAVLIEPEGADKKILRVTLPLGMQLQPGTRIIIDQGQPTTGPYVICFTNGCMADYEANADIIGKLKKGQTLSVQAINSGGQPVSLALPLADFAKANDGPPTDPKVFEEQQKKLQDELQKPRRRGASEAGKPAGRATEANKPAAFAQPKKARGAPCGAPLVVSRRSCGFNSARKLRGR